MPSDYGKKLDAIIRDVRKVLKPGNFRGSGRSLNRIQPDGIVHGITFQMGQNWSVLWGKYTVEYGFFIPEVFSALNERSIPKIISTPVCAERHRLVKPGNTANDKWWSLNDGSINTAEVLDLLAETAEPYFFQHDSRESIISVWEEKRKQKQLQHREILMLVIMLCKVGESSRAEDILEDEFSNQYKTTFLEYARNVVTPFGLKFPPLL